MYHALAHFSWPVSDGCRVLSTVYLLLFVSFSILYNFTLGWPKLQWFVTANLNRHPKDWQPPSNLDRSSPAYIEVC